MFDSRNEKVSGVDQTPETSHLIIGYGNLDRQDDGVAWHVLNSLACSLGTPIPEDSSEIHHPHGLDPSLLYTLQLTPDLAETLISYTHVCFVDAHTGALPTDFSVTPIVPDFQASPFTHHLTPNTLLSLCQTLYGKVPAGVLLSIRGYEFGFSHDLSPQTAALAIRAVKWIADWLQSPPS